jgi:spermidine synthase
MKKSLYFEIFAVSLAAILLEISYTRVFSFKVWYYFTYLLIGIALLGLGAGGIFVAVIRPLRKAEPAQLIPAFCFIGGASICGGYLIIARIQLNISELGLGIELGKLVWTCLLLMLPFLATGIIISKILSTFPEAAGRLYAADLLGAGIGCIVCIPLLVLLDPPRVIMAAAGIFAVGGIRLAIKSRFLLIVGGIIAAAPVVCSLNEDLLPDPRVDIGKTYGQLVDKKGICFSEWHPVFRVDVQEVPTSFGNTRLLLHDGQAGSAIRRFTGDFEAFDYLHTDPRALPFELLPEEPEVLIIGSAGGIEIVASLLFGAAHVTALELNPVTVSLLNETYADYTGRLGENPRVTLVNGEGRWFLKQSTEKYDLIWLVAPDSYAAMNASSAAAFVLAESYLYTVEMLKESLDHLTEKGVLCAQFGEMDYSRKPNRTTRFVSTAREAYSQQNIRDFGDHVVVATTLSYPVRYSTVLLSKAPLTFDQVGRVKKKVSQLRGGMVCYLPGRRTDDSPVNQAITLADEALEEWYAAYPYLVDPIYDDSPFFWHFGRFRDAFFPSQIMTKQIDREDYIAEGVSIILLIVAAIFAAVFLILPFIVIHKTWVRIPYKFPAGIYFASLGLGFMFIEVTLIQMLTLFLGYPTRSLSVTLFGLLVFSGLGSFLSERYTAHRNGALAILLAVLVGLTLFYQYGLPFVVEHFIVQPVAIRIVLAVMMIAPTGLCLGAFMPIGLTTAANATDHKREYVAWAWAVNGFFSVIASILSTVLAMIIGFRLLLLLALVIYAIGVISLTRLPHKAAN